MMHQASDVMTGSHEFFGTEHAFILSLLKQEGENNEASDDSR
jgi:hypothetical protein